MFPETTNVLMWFKERVPVTISCYKTKRVFLIIKTTYFILWIQFQCLVFFMSQ